MHNAGAAVSTAVPAFCLLCTVLGCAGESAPTAAPALFDLAGDTVRLSPGALMYEVTVAARQGAEFEPSEVTLRAGDALRVTALDAGPHAVRFEAPLHPAASEFLEATGQTRGLPLMDAGAAWVIAFEGAPAGTWTIRCLTHDAALAIEVRGAGPRR